MQWIDKPKFLTTIITIIVDPFSKFAQALSLNFKALEIADKLFNSFYTMAKQHKQFLDL